MKKYCSECRLFKIGLKCDIHGTPIGPNKCKYFSPKKKIDSTCQKCKYLDDSNHDKTECTLGHDIYQYTGKCIGIRETLKRKEVEDDRYYGLHP